MAKGNGIDLENFSMKKMKCKKKRVNKRKIKINMGGLFMFKKTKVRSILDLLGKNLSAREVSKVLGVSRNTVAEVQALFLQSGRSWDDISEWDDDRLYGLFYPDKFKYKPRYAPVDYSYVHKELKKTGVTEKLLWEEYCARCEKDGVSACS